jgi:peptidoglycan/xylan/chitin deacetylase (PgdA/CDA1 family)
MNYGAAAAVFAAGGYAISTLLPWSGVHDWLVPTAVRRTDAPGVAWTFDDGPHAERTPRLLDLLARAGQRATFFVVGREVRRNPQLTRRILAEGHALGNHSYTHPWMPGLSTRAIHAELAECQRAVEDVTGVAPTVVRPPYGHRDARFYRVARELGLVPVLWSVDTIDYAGLAADRVERRAARARAGDVVLFHDGNARARGTLPAIERLLARLGAEGAAMVPIVPIVPLLVVGPRASAALEARS